jgi:hypothetical protein
MRQQMHTLVLAIVLSTAVGFGIATLTRPADAEAGSTATAAASDARIVRELRKVNNSIGANYKKYSLIGITDDGFNDVYRAIVQACNADPDTTSCPSFVH